MKFNIGDKVYKPKGYTYKGVVVAAFLNLSHEERYVVEIPTSECGCGSTNCQANCVGMLHIFSGEQLELSE